MLTKILLPLDGSPLAAKALPVVERLVGKSDTRVTLLMVGEPPRATASERSSGKTVAVTTTLPGASPVRVVPGRTARYAENRDQAVERRENEMLDTLKEAAQQLVGTGAAVEFEVAFGEPADEITRLARRGGFDVICMATHGRSGLREVLHGSVTEAVIRSRVAPVLVVPAGEATP